MNASTNLPALTPANRSLPVSDAIEDAIASLRRSGGADCPECEQVAMGTVAYLFRLTKRQAWAAWISYAAAHASDLAV